jgi:hypothetical protein
MLRPMDNRGQLEAGPVVAAAGGLLAIASLFLDWYEPGISGWTAFEALDLMVAGAALGSLRLSIAVDADASRATGHAEPADPTQRLGPTR